MEAGGNEQMLINVAADPHLNDTALFYSCLASDEASKKKN